MSNKVEIGASRAAIKGKFGANFAKSTFHMTSLYACLFLDRRAVSEAMLMCCSGKGNLRS